MKLDAKNKPIDDADLARLLRNEIDTATGSDWDDEQTSRADALDYYFGRAPGRPSTAGRSGAISSDVADMVEALKAQIMPSFSGDDIVSFEAQGPQDEKQAQLESDLCNYMVMERSNGYTVLYEAVHDALLLRNCIVKVYTEQYERVNKKKYPEEIPPETLQLLQSQTEDRLFAEKSGNGTILTRLVQVKKLCIETVNPDNFVLASDHRSLDMQNCRFCGEWTIKTAGQLTEMGYPADVIEDLPSADSDTSGAGISHNQIQGENDHFWYEASARPIKIWEIYMQLDADGDGYPELHRIVWPENTDVILEDELVEWVPYACGTPFINPHRWLGLGIFDKLKAVADGKTDVLRQWVDNSRYHNNKALIGVKGQVDYSGILNRRPGGYIEEKSPGMVRELAVSDIGPSCMNFMNYMDKMRTEKTGASLDMQSQGLPSGDETAHGVERQMTFKEQLAGMITRTLAETVVRGLFLLVHRTLRVYFPGTIAARKAGMWLESDPQTWGERENVNVNVGYSIGERTRQAATLAQIIAMQQQYMQMGLDGILCGANQLYNAQVQFCRLSGLDNPDQFWVNPNSDEARSAAEAKARQAQEAAMQQAGMSGKIIEIEAFKQAQAAEEKLRQHELNAAKMVLDQEDVRDDNMRAWAELELKYQRPIAGKGIDESV